MADEESPERSKGLPQRGPAQPIEEGDEAGARHTTGDAPTDAAHQDAGDGTLTGSVPAGLSSDELRDRARTPRQDDAGSEQPGQKPARTSRARMDAGPLPAGSVKPCPAASAK